MSIYHGITPDSDSVILVTGFAATETTREQMREELARAIGWTQGKASGVWFSPPDSPELCVYNVPPNPYDSTEDSRALVAWLAADNERWSEFRQELVSIWVSVNGDDLLRFTLTAPLPVIADAAWQVIQEKQ